MALAAHLLQTESCPDAAKELTNALALAPNWRDLACTAYLVQLAGGRPAPPPIERGGLLGASIQAVADFFADAPGSNEHLRLAVVQGGAECVPVWRAIAAILPVTEALRERAMDYFNVVCAASGRDSALVGIACVYAFESELWTTAASYAAECNAQRPLAVESWPAWAWLTAMSGDLAAFVTIASQCERAQIAPRWLLSALSVAARTASDPVWVAEQMAELVRARDRSGDQLDELYGGLMLIRDQVSTEWLARVSGALADLVSHDPLPFQAFRGFVASGQDERMLRTLHPEIREAVDFLRLR